MGNIFIKSDSVGEIKSDKKSIEKIDGVVVTMMVFNRVICCGNDDLESMYEGCEILLT